jgi:hypothetical protein
LSDTLSFAPAWAVWGALLIGVFAVACFLHAGALAFLNRILRQRRPNLNRLLTATKNPTRLALLLIALAAALPAAPLGPNGRLIFIRSLVVGTIFLIGWTALKVLHIGADLYLRNFHIDAPDNLLARKHLTQVRVLLRVLDTIIVLLTLGSALMTFDIVRQYGISLFASAGVAGVVFGLAAQPVLSNLIAGISARTDAANSPRRRGHGPKRIWMDRRNQRDLCCHPAMGSAAAYRAAQLFHSAAVLQLDAPSGGQYRQRVALSRLQRADRAHSGEGRRIRGTNKTAGWQACECAGYQHQPGRDRIAGPGNGSQRGRHLQSLRRTARKADCFLTERMSASLTAATPRDQRAPGSQKWQRTEHRER